MTSPAPSAPPPIKTLHILLGAVISGLVIVAVVMWRIAGSEPLEPIYVGVLLVIAVAAAVMCATVGFRVPAIDPETPFDQAVTEGQLAFRTSTFVRMAVAEGVGIVSVPLAFVGGSGALTLIGVPLSLALFARYVWPTDAVVAKVESALDAKGAHSYLADTLHGREPGSGPGPMLPI